MSTKTASILAVAFIAAVLAITHFDHASARAESNAGASLNDKNPTQVLIGNYRVMLDSGSGEVQFDQIRRIELHEQYVVLFGYTGNGRFVPAGTIKNMTWQPI